MSHGIQGLSASPAMRVAVSSPSLKAAVPNAAKEGDTELRQTFDSFVGELFFGQMMKSMRNTVGKPAYFHGGQAEEIFTQQLDQVLGEKMTKASASSFTGPMFELFALNRS
jgi:Rod binding domain-containing protein